MKNAHFNIIVLMAVGGFIAAVLHMIFVKDVREHPQVYFCQDSSLKGFIGIKSKNDSTELKSYFEFLNIDSTKVDFPLVVLFEDQMFYALEHDNENNMTKIAALRTRSTRARPMKVVCWVYDGLICYYE